MKIFISWSGKRSRAVAKALSDWLPKVIQAVKPFYSPEIEKGTKSINEINSSLEGTSFGIICLNAENLESPWIHYEAGALAKTEGARVWTLLHGLSHSDVAQPLAQFQHTLTTKEDINKLLDSINNKLPEPLDKRILDSSFERWWSDLESEFGDATELSDTTVVTKNMRSDREILDEILELLRNQQRKQPYIDFSEGLPSRLFPSKLFQKITFTSKIIEGVNDTAEFVRKLSGVFPKSIVEVDAASEEDLSYEIELQFPREHGDLTARLISASKKLGFEFSFFYVIDPNGNRVRIENPEYRLPD